MASDKFFTGPKHEALPESCETKVSFWSSEFLDGSEACEGPPKLKYTFLNRLFHWQDIEMHGHVHQLTVACMALAFMRQ